MFRTRRWRLLLNLIDHLPRNSSYVEAQLADTELAEALLASDQEMPAPRRRMSEWSPEVEALAAVVDRLGEVVAVLVAVNGGKPGQLKPYLRPVTAADEVRARQAHQSHLRLLSKITYQDEEGS